MDNWLAISVGGGLLISLAAISFLALSGRILGVSGIAFGLLPPRRGDISWRAAFLCGLIVSGYLAKWFFPDLENFTIQSSTPTLIAAGLLVGCGARLGCGCTSGHGICGVGRFSKRSIVATLCFIASGAATVYVVKHVVGA